MEQRQDQDNYEVLKALFLSAGSSVGAAGGCGQAPARHDGLHEGHQSGGPILAAQAASLYTAVASSSTEYGRLFAEYQDVPQHKEESGKHQLIMMASMKVIRAVAPSGGPGGLYTVVASSSTEYGPLFAEYQDVPQHKEEVIRAVAPFGGPTTAWAAAGLEDEASSIQPAAS